MTSRAIGLVNYKGRISYLAKVLHFGGPIRIECASKVVLAGCAMIFAIIKQMFVEHMVFAILGGIVGIVILLFTPWIEKWRNYIDPPAPLSKSPVYHHNVTIEASADGGHVATAHTSMTIPKDNLTTEDFEKITKSMLPQIGGANPPALPPAQP